MAILEKKKSKVSDEVPSASMADIAFLLLIFFLVTTTFPKDRGLAIVLPEEGGEVQISAAEHPSHHHSAQWDRRSEAW